MEATLGYASPDLVVQIAEYSKDNNAVAIKPVASSKITMKPATLVFALSSSSTYRLRSSTGLMRWISDSAKSPACVRRVLHLLIAA
jgi:hypothetical protein